MSTLDILKLNCEKCKLRTEHVRVYSSSDGKLRYRCLKCGNSRDSAVEDREKNFPDYNAQPCGVG